MKLNLIFNKNKTKQKTKNEHCAKITNSYSLEFPLTFHFIFETLFIWICQEVELFRTSFTSTNLINKWFNDIVALADEEPQTVTRNNEHVTFP